MVLFIDQELYGFGCEALYTYVYQENLGGKSKVDIYNMNCCETDLIRKLKLGQQKTNYGILKSLRIPNLHRLAFCAVSSEIPSSPLCHTCR